MCHDQMMTLLIVILVMASVLHLLSLLKNKNASSFENVTKKRKRIDAISSKLWHCRLGHISRGRIEHLVKASILPPLESSELEQCIDCIKGKFSKNKER